MDEASELLEFAGRNVPGEDAYARAALRLAEASVAAAEGRRATASAAVDEALRLLEEQQLRTDLGEARIAYARALHRFGHTAEAEAQLERARETFAEMEAEALVAEIDLELRELGERSA